MEAGFLSYKDFMDIPKVTSVLTCSYIIFYPNAMNTICPDVLINVHHFLSLNEVEKGELVSRDWKKSLKSHGHSPFHQKRIFHHLKICYRKFYIRDPDFSAYIAKLLNFRIMRMLLVSIST